MTESDRVRLGVELITFYNTVHWGLPRGLSYGDWIAAFLENPRANYDRILDEAAQTGVEGVELAPDPANWHTARLAYGDAAGFAKALAQRNLAVGSSYENAAGVVLPALSDPEFEPQADARIAEHAQFITELGASTIVMGTMRRSTFAPFVEAVPADDMERVTAQYNRLGKVAGRFGAKLAIHTDSYSVCSRPQDITRFLELTDPETVQLCIDAGHVTLDGGDAADILAAHVDRVPVMHWKDCVGHLDPETLPGSDPMEQHEVQLTWFRGMGDGIVDWHRWQTVLKDADWSGWAMTELDMAPDPIADTRAALAYYTRELAPIHS